MDEENTLTPEVISTGVVTPLSIVKEMEESYLQYSMSVIVSRALPDPTPRCLANLVVKTFFDRSKLTCLRRANEPTYVRSLRRRTLSPNSFHL